MTRGLSVDEVCRSMPVVCLMKVAMARKQYFAGVVNENKTGRTCAVSGRAQIRIHLNYTYVK